MAARLRDGRSRRAPERAPVSPETQSAPAVVNRQSKVEVDVGRVRSFLLRLLAALDLKGCAMNVGFVDDEEMARLNARFRGQAEATDVLSFPWADEGEIGKWKLENGKSKLEKRNSKIASRNSGRQRLVSNFQFPVSELKGFLGDIVISAETARRNARAEGHSAENEIRWLILHGVLHLCGFDHERDGGEMTALELKLRARLRI